VPPPIELPPTFSSLVARTPADAPIDLELGAILLAQDFDPSVRPRRVVEALESLYASLTPSRWKDLDVDAAARALAHALFVEQGLSGNEQDYGDPRNSFVHLVLERRLGIPISLSIVYLSMARRLGIPASGVSFPGHYLVRVERDRGPLILDPFRGGRALDTEEMTRMIRRATHSQARLSVTHLRRATERQTLQRVLQNLKIAFAARGALPNALLACTRILELNPDDASVTRDRGVLQARLGLAEGAAADLTRYLELRPDANDAATIRAAIASLSSKRASATLN
jgi:regulator of sirC expression with transglutaminase-like and TPR domain